jgi:hypothetical protein
MKKKLLMYLAIFSVFGFLTASSANATPELFGSNYYDFILVSNNVFDGKNTWVSAESASEASVFNGVTGHLATITSQAENDFLYSLVDNKYKGFIGAWIGGQTSHGWVVGPEQGNNFTYTNWGGHEPNNPDYYAYMNIGDGSVYINGGQWADDSSINGAPDNNDPVIGYFVEYEGAAPVPEPATMLLLGSGLMGLAGFRKRFLKK